MRKQINSFLQKHRQLLLYLVFGVLTTAVNYAVYLPLHNSATMLASVANVVAWIAAVLFAFVTNKPLVFTSSDWAPKTVISEFAKFVGARLGSMAIETLIIFLCVDILSWNGIVIKLATSVLVIVLNYISSKFLVFKKDR